MKTYSYIVTFLLISFCILGINGLIEARKESDLQQSEINGLKKSNKEEADRLRSELAITRDSLNVAFETIRIANKETQEAHERTQRIIKRYEQIIFISYTSDSARHRKLSELYPSY